jgi:hypothetical protein
MYIVVMSHNFNKETKVFEFMCKMQAWAALNGFTLTQSENVSHVYYVTF